MTRDGELCNMASAHHRMMVAEALGLAVVPGVIRGAHPSWIQRCVDRYGTHPRSAMYAGFSHELQCVAL